MSLQRRWRIADEDAIHRLVGCKGASGIKPCLMCCNVFLKGEVRDIVASDRTGTAVHHSEPDAAHLMATTMCLLMAMCRRLREAVGTMNKGEFEELERRLGWNWDPGLPARLQKLNPLKTVMFDWMHCMFVNGTYNVLVYHMFKALKPFGVTWARADAYFQDWVFPRCVHVAPDTYAIFGEKRSKSHWEGKRLKCTASECLATIHVSWHATHFRTLGRGAGCRWGDGEAKGALQRLGCALHACADWRASSGRSAATLQRPCGRPAPYSKRT